MKNKTLIKINIVIFFLLFLGLSAADMLTQDRYFSRNENRILTAKPQLTFESLLDGSFTEKYEDYVTDQFLARDTWIQLKNYSELLLQKKELNGVYLAKDHSLIEKHGAAQIEEKKALSKADRLSERTAEYEQLLGPGHVKVMLVPTADIVLADKLPAFATEFDQSAYLEQIQSRLSDKNMLIAVEDTLAEHSQEYIYYKTDHHWTTQGAYYAYLKWAEAVDEVPYTAWEKTVVSDDFLGTLHSKINLNIPTDQIEFYEKQNPSSYQVDYLYEGKTSGTFYDMEKLRTKDQYAVFFGGNFPLVSIQTGTQNSKHLLIVKDSYANSFVPFVTDHYQSVILLDPRYYRDDVKKVIQEKGITDVLFLYDVIHFIDNY